VVRIRMKSLGRRHRPFFRICAMDIRSPRDGRAIEELGHHDPMVRNVQARTVLNVNRIRYWLSVGAQPSQKVQALLNRYGVKKPAPGEPWALPEAAPAATTETTTPPATAPAATAPTAPAPAATPEPASAVGTSGGEAPVS
jgi:small subunit ribosomal protein S16